MISAKPDTWKANISQIIATLNKINEQTFDLIIKILKMEKPNDCIQYKKKVVQQQFKNIAILNKCVIFVFQDDCNKFETLRNETLLLSNFLEIIIELDFNKQNFSIVKFQESRKTLISLIQQDETFLSFLKFIVCLTAIDSRFIQCGSNSLNLLVELKMDLIDQNFEVIRITNTSLVGANFERSNLSHSKFDNVDIRGMNLNRTQLFYCKWKNIRLHEQNMLAVMQAQSVISVFF